MKRENKAAVCPQMFIYNICKKKYAPWGFLSVKKVMAVGADAKRKFVVMQDNDDETFKRL